MSVGWIRRLRDRPSRRVGEHETSGSSQSSSGSSASAIRAARRFLRGYLGYIYGYGRAAQVSEATSRLARSLPDRAPMVPPSIRARHPRVVALHAVMAPSGAIRVTALINDGGLADYSLELRMTELGGRLLVAGAGGA